MKVDSVKENLIKGVCNLKASQRAHGGQSTGGKSEMPEVSFWSWEAWAEALDFASFSSVLRGCSGDKLT